MVFLERWALVESITPELFALYIIVLSEMREEGNEAALAIPEDMNMQDWAENIYNNEWPKHSLAHTIKSRAQARIVINRIKHGPVQGST